MLLSIVVSGAGPVGAVILVLLLADAYFQGASANGGMPDQDQAVQLCVLKGLIRLSENGGIPQNAEDGHGREYDRLAELCRQDHTRFNVDNGKEANP